MVEDEELERIKKMMERLLRAEEGRRAVWPRLLHKRLHTNIVLPLGACLPPRCRRRKHLRGGLFVGLMYASWSWKMFIGLVSDGLPLSWRGRRYRRMPWFVLAGVLYASGTLVMLFEELETAPVWTVMFPAVVAILMAGAFYDMAADSYAVDVTPPEYHARVFGSVSTASQSIGSAMACVLPTFILAVGGYNLVFTVAGITGLTAFLFLTAREPELEHERVFSLSLTALVMSALTGVVLLLGILIQPYEAGKATRV